MLQKKIKIQIPLLQDRRKGFSLDFLQQYPSTRLKKGMLWKQFYFIKRLGIHQAKLSFTLSA